MRSLCKIFNEKARYHNDCLIDLIVLLLVKFDRTVYNTCVMIGLCYFPSVWDLFTIILTNA